MAISTVLDQLLANPETIIGQFQGWSSLTADLCRIGAEPSDDQLFEGNASGNLYTITGRLKFAIDFNYPDLVSSGWFRCTNRF